MKRKIFANIVALLFASLSVIYSVFVIRFDYDLLYKVELVNLPQGFHPVQKNLNFSVRYSCSHILMGILKNDRTVNVQVDVTSNLIRSVIFLLNIDTSELVKPIPFCSVSSVSPKIINVEFQRMYSKYLRVLPDIVGNVPDNYFYSFSVSPPYVMATGLEGKLKERDVIYTEIIDIQGRFQDFSIRIPLRKDEDIDLETDVVLVSFKIRQR